MGSYLVDEDEVNDRRRKKQGDPRKHHGYLDTCSITDLVNFNRAVAGILRMPRHLDPMQPGNKRNRLNQDDPQVRILLMARADFDSAFAAVHDRAVES